MKVSEIREVVHLLLEDVEVHLGRELAAVVDWEQALDRRQHVPLLLQEELRPQLDLVLLARRDVGAFLQ